MVAYAAGEVVPANTEDDHEGVVLSPDHVTSRKHGGMDRCYEIVTAWVHPQFRGLNLSWHMYAMIFQQGVSSYCLSPALKNAPSSPSLPHLAHILLSS